MSLTATEKTDIINTVNGADFPNSPHVEANDIMWYPGDHEVIKAGNSLKLVYKDGKWEENSDQTHEF